MYSQSKIGFLPLRIWLFIFLGVQVFFLVIMVATFGTQYWVFTQIDNAYITSYEFAPYYTGALVYNDYFDGSNFKGAYTTCTEGCDGTFASQTSDWCNIYRNLNDNENPCFFTCPEQWVSESLCATFYLLLVGLVVFFLFEVASMIGICVWSCTMFCAAKRFHQCFCTTYCCAVFSCVSHYIAIISWLVITGAKYNNDCDAFPDTGGRIQMCNSDGPRLALFMMIVFPIAVVIYFIIACAGHSRQIALGQPGGIQMGEVPAIHQPGPTSAYGGGQQFNPIPGQYNPGNAPYYNPGNPPQYNPGNPPQYNPGNPPQYNPGNTPYNPINQPYNPENPPYNPGNPPYNPGNPPYNPGNPPYNPGNPIYPPPYDSPPKGEY